MVRSGCRTAPRMTEGKEKQFERARADYDALLESPDAFETVKQLERYRPTLIRTAEIAHGARLGLAILTVGAAAAIALSHHGDSGIVPALMNALPLILFWPVAHGLSGFARGLREQNERVTGQIIQLNRDRTFLKVAFKT